MRLRGSRSCLSIAAASVLILVSIGCQAQRVEPQVQLSLAGAQIAVELVESWLQTAKNPYFTITRVQPVYLSQHGYAALARGECDLACTDRLITWRELEAFKDRQPEGTRVGFYGFGLYVNRANPVDSIYAGHLELLFKKKITTWKELGGRDEPVALYGPVKDTRGGTVLARQAGIWFAEPTWTALKSDAEIIGKVAADPAALGFANLGLDHDVRYLGIRMDRHGQAAFPSLEEIESEKYGLAKVIYVYCRTPPSDKATKAIDWLLGERGRQAMASTEVWQIARERATAPQPAPTQ